MAQTVDHQQQQTASKTAAIPGSEKQSQGLSMPAVPALRSAVSAPAVPPPAANGAGIVQRTLVPFKRPEMQDDVDEALIADANTINDLTEEGAENTWTKLNSGNDLNIDDFPGSTVGHFTNFMNRLAGHDNALKAAATGYIIEDYVSNNDGLPDTAESQVVMGNARPDFVVTRAGRRGVVDITSEGQQGHVMDKAFNKSGFATIDEATYGNFNFDNLAEEPAFTGDALEMAAAAKRRRADAFLGSQLLQLKKHAELYSSGIMWGNLGFSLAVLEMKNRVNIIAAAEMVWGNDDIAYVDASIAALNTRLANAGFHITLPTLTRIIEKAQEEYLVAGNPRWS